MLGCDVAGFADIQATALKAAISGSIFAAPEACFVMTMALPFGSTRALLTAQDISAWPPLRKLHPTAGNVLHTTKRACRLNGHKSQS
jgi:hypothetical protein